MLVGIVGTKHCQDMIMIQMTKAMLMIQMTKAMLLIQMIKGRLLEAHARSALCDSWLRHHHLDALLSFPISPLNDNHLISQLHISTPHHSVLNILLLEKWYSWKPRRQYIVIYEFGFSKNYNQIWWAFVIKQSRNLIPYELGLILAVFEVNNRQRLTKLQKKSISLCSCNYQ